MANNILTGIEADFWESQLQAEILQEDYYEFFKFFWDEVSSESLVDNWHIETVCRELQTIGEWVINREPKQYDLIINIPPGSSKSTMCTILFHPWLWANDPSIQIVTTSFSSPLSTKHSVESREVIRGDKFQSLFGDKFRIRNSEDSKTFYRNSAGGFRMATSTGAMVTGNHGHIILIDDPIDPKGARSEAIMTGVNDYVNKTLNSRKVDKRNTPTIMVMQRLHENDPSGDWLEKSKTGKKPIRHICIPATMEFDIYPNELAGNYVNGLMDPIRIPQSVLDEEHTNLGSVDFAGQYGQNPMAVGGNKVKYSWFNYCDLHELPQGIIWDLWIDGAYTKNTANDPTGLAVMGYHKPTNRLFIRHAHDDHLEMPDLLKMLVTYIDTHELDGRSRLRIEPKATGKTLKQLVNSDARFFISALEIKSHLVSEGKEARLQVASPKIEAGQVWLVRGNWNESFTHQLCGFPNAKRDEFVDLIGYACDHYFMKPKGTGVRITN